MKKIRINELARELEVKAHEILERLPELGVSEKKTHSSSIDEDVAIKLRQYYGQDVPDYVHDPNADDSGSEDHHDEQHEERADAHAESDHEAPAPVARSGGPPAPPAHSGTHSGTSAATEAPPAEAPAGK